MKKIRSFKGFDKDLKCRGYQYEVGKTYIHDGDLEICKSGFHASENPLDVLDYYNDMNCRFCEVEQFGTVARGDKKIASSKIKIKAEIGFIGLFNAGIEWLKENTFHKPNSDFSQGDYAKIGSGGGYAKICSSGDCAQIGSSGGYAKIGSGGGYAKIGSSGDYAKIGSSGDFAKIGSSGDYAKIGSSGDCAQICSSGGYAKISSSGDYAKIDSSGENSVICCSGRDSMVRAKIGSCITLSEWVLDKSKRSYVPICVKTEYVDGERIKGDTWYELKNGEFVEQDI